MKTDKLPVYESVLFVCSGNTCRSPMAEAIYNDLCKKHGLDSYATSCGIAAWDGMRASFGAMQAMEEMGIDLSFHTARLIDKIILQQADLVLCMGGSHAQYILQNFPSQAGKVHVLAPFALGENKAIEDPFGADTEIYRKCAAQIARAVENLVARMEKA